MNMTKSWRYLYIDSRARRTPHKRSHVFFGRKKHVTSMPILETQTWAQRNCVLVNGVWFVGKGSNHELRSFISEAQPGEHHLPGCVFLLEDRNMSDTTTKFGEADMQRFVSVFVHTSGVCWRMKEDSRLLLYIDSRARKAPPCGWWPCS